jgi:hypothetical protein
MPAFIPYNYSPRSRIDAVKRAIVGAMKNKLDKVTDVPVLSAKAELIVLNSHIHQTSKKAEGDGAEEIAAASEVPSKCHEHSVIRHICRQRQACFRCPCRLGLSRSFCCE